MSRVLHKEWRKAAQHFLCKRKQEVAGGWRYRSAHSPNNTNLTESGSGSASALTDRF